MLESTLLLFWGKKSIFLFDSHGSNTEGYHDPSGQSVLLKFSWITILNNVILKYFEETFNNSACLEYDILHIKAEVVNNVHFVRSSNQLVKLNDVSHNNAEISADKQASDKQLF